MTTFFRSIWLPIRAFVALLSRTRGLPPAADARMMALARIIRERQAQEAKWGARFFPRGGLGFGSAAAQVEMGRLQAECDKAMLEGTCTFAHVLREEVAELIASTTEAEALTEAVQVGAVVIKLIEYLDRHDRIVGRPLRVYVAAGQAEKLIATGLASHLHDRGHVIVSKWHKEMTPKTDHTSQLVALRDRTKALRSADVVVAWMASGWYTDVLGDVGYGLAFGKPTMIVKRSDERSFSLYESEKHVTVVHLDDANAMDVVADAFDAFSLRIRKECI